MHKITRNRYYVHGVLMLLCAAANLHAANLNTGDALFVWRTNVDKDPLGSAAKTQDLIDFCYSYGINTVFISVQNLALERYHSRYNTPISFWTSEIKIRNYTQWANLISDLHAVGIKVEALVGGDYSNTARNETAFDDVLAYQQAHNSDPSAQFDGIQVDYDRYFTDYLYRHYYEDIISQFTYKRSNAGYDSEALPVAWVVLSNRFNIFPQDQVDAITIAIVDAYPPVEPLEGSSSITIPFRIARYYNQTLGDSSSIVGTSYDEDALFYVKSRSLYSRVFAYDPRVPETDDYLAFYQGEAIDGYDCRWEVHEENGTQLTTINAYPEWLEANGYNDTSGSIDALTGFDRDLKDLFRRDYAYFSNDTDGDGIEDYIELINFTNLLKADTDDDGISDPDEIAAGLNPNIAAALDSSDSDKDGIPNLLEIAHGTDPFSDSSYPTIFNVNTNVSSNGHGTASDPYNSIAAAVEQIKGARARGFSAFATVELLIGEHEENVTIDVDNVMLHGENGGGTIIKGSITVTADDVSVFNLTVKDSPTHGILLRPGIQGAHVQGCIIENSTRVGIQCHNITNALIQENLIRNNSGDGIWVVNGGDEITILRNTITNNNIGILLNNSIRDIYFINNEITANRYAAVSATSAGSNFAVRSFKHNNVYSNNTQGGTYPVAFHQDALLIESEVYGNYFGDKEHLGEIYQGLTPEMLKPLAIHCYSSEINPIRNLQDNGPGGLVYPKRIDSYIFSAGTTAQNIQTKLEDIKNNHLANHYFLILFESGEYDAQGTRIKVAGLNKVVFESTSGNANDTILKNIGFYFDGGSSSIEFYKLGFVAEGNPGMAAIFLQNGKDYTVKNCTFDHYWGSGAYAIRIAGAYGTSLLEGNTLNTCGIGIALLNNSTGVTIAENTFGNSWRGISMESGAHHNAITGNIIAGATQGITFSGNSHHIDVNSNSFTDTATALLSAGGVDISLSGNTFTNVTTETSGDGFIQ